MTPKNIVYITYDGLMEPLGQSQVLSYLEVLSQDPRFKITIMSYEKQSDWSNLKSREELSKKVHSKNIRWVALRYHKSPSALATAYDVFVGYLTLSRLMLTGGIDVIHARSYVAALIALPFAKLNLVKMIFDMRGFWADERVDGEIWNSSSLLYKFAKFFEKQYLTTADTVVSLTHAAISEMKTWPYLKNRNVDFRVITTCTNLENFQPNYDPIESTHSFTVGYIGSVDHWYLFEPTVRAFRMIKDVVPQATFQIFSRDKHDFIRGEMQRVGFQPADFRIQAVPFSKIPAHMKTFALTVYFIKPAYSKIASAPTKLGEFLACGIPCLTNSKIGDSEAIILENRVGAITHELTDSAIRSGVETILDLLDDPNLKSRCRATAEKYFALNNGVEAYREIYLKA